MSVCPNLGQHTPHPTGYLGHSAWAEQMILTHDQRECSGCNRPEIWEPIDPAVLHAPAIADSDCSRCGTYYAEGALIRTDGDRGWIASGCCPLAETKVQSGETR